MTAVCLREPPRTIGAWSEIEGFKKGIACECFRADIALALQQPEVGAVHDHKGAVSTREDVEASAVEAISLVSLTHRLTETEIGEELSENVHSV